MMAGDDVRSPGTAREGARRACAEFRGGVPDVESAGDAQRGLLLQNVQYLQDLVARCSATPIDGVQAVEEGAPWAGLLLTSACDVALAAVRQKGLKEAYPALHGAVQALFRAGVDHVLERLEALEPDTLREGAGALLPVCQESGHDLTVMNLSFKLQTKLLVRLAALGPAALGPDGPTQQVAPAPEYPV